MKTKNPEFTTGDKGGLNIIQAIELAIAHELKAPRKSYLALAQESDDPELKQLLREIAQEEAHHEATLRSRLRLYQEKHLLRDTISRYVSPEMCEEILKNPDLLHLGGRRQPVTVLFADIKGFTAMSESIGLFPDPWWKCLTSILPRWWTWSSSIKGPWINLWEMP